MSLADGLCVFFVLWLLPSTLSHPSAVCSTDILLKETRTTPSRHRVASRDILRHASSFQSRILELGLAATFLDTGEDISEGFVLVAGLDVVVGYPFRRIFLLAFQPCHHFAVVEDLILCLDQPLLRQLVLIPYGKDLSRFMNGCP